MAAQEWRAALVAGGNDSRVDAFVLLGVVASALVVSLGTQIVDLIVGPVITAVILKITWESLGTVRAAEIELAHVDRNDAHFEGQLSP